MVAVTVAKLLIIGNAQMWMGSVLIATMCHGVGMASLPLMLTKPAMMPITLTEMAARTVKLINFISAQQTFVLFLTQAVLQLAIGVAVTIFTNLKLVKNVTTETQQKQMVVVMDVK